LFLPLSFLFYFPWSSLWSKEQTLHSGEQFHEEREVSEVTKWRLKANCGTKIIKLVASVFKNRIRPLRYSNENRVCPVLCACARARARTHTHTHTHTHIYIYIYIYQCLCRNGTLKTEINVEIIPAPLGTGDVQCLRHNI
jgi:hypothetical protein